MGSRTRSLSIADVVHLLSQLEVQMNLRWLYSKWRQMVLSYTTRKLTDPNDLLPAISGIAKYFALKTNDEYHAGLWQGDLVEGLLWCPRNGFGSADDLLRKPASLSYICPTWSWAQHGEVYFPCSSLPEDDVLQGECKILKASSVPENPRLNPWGRIVQSSLQVQANFILATGRLARAPRPHLYSYDRRPMFTSVLDKSTLVSVWFDWVVLIDVIELYLEDAVFMLFASSHYTSSLLFGDIMDDHAVSEDGKAEDRDPPRSSLETETYSDEVPYQSMDNVTEGRLGFSSSGTQSTVSETNLGPRVESRFGLDSNERNPEHNESSPRSMEQAHSILSQSGSDHDHGLNQTRFSNEKEKLNKHAWGLLLKRLADGTYVRIGMFHSAPEQGGLCAFKAASCKEFHIV